MSTKYGNNNHVCIFKARFQDFEIAQAVSTDLRHRTSAAGTACFQSIRTGIRHDYTYGIQSGWTHCSEHTHDGLMKKQRDRETDKGKEEERLMDSTTHT